MIEIRNVIDLGIGAAIRGMRNPYMSHAKSDSVTCMDMYPNCGKCPVFKDFKHGHSYCVRNITCNVENLVIGPNDMALAKRLIKAGSEHRKFLRMIHVLADVKAPRYWWAEMDKYKFVEANSSSTMHLITKRELTMEDFGDVNNGVKTVLQDRIIPILNEWIMEYQIASDSEERTNILRSIKQLLPESYLQLRTIDFDYETALTIWHQRHNHRLDEWSGENGFCTWIKSLPYMNEFLEALK